MVALCGANGSGKTTLLRTLTRSIKPTSGEIRIYDSDIHSLPPHFYARLVSYLPQTRPTPQITVSALVSHGRFPYLEFPRRLNREDRARVNDAIDLLGLSDLRYKLLTELSGGERQRVYLAMQLVQDSHFMLLDEPTAHLDMRHQFETLSLLRSFANNERGILLVLHDLAAAANYADRVIIMHEGRLVLNATPNVLPRSRIVADTLGVRLVEFNGRYTVVPI